MSTYNASIGDSNVKTLFDSLNDFITSGDQVQLKRPVKYGTSPKTSFETRKELDKLIEECDNMFSKNQYDVGTSTYPLLEIPTEGPLCISAPYTMPLKFRPWVDNTLNKLLEAGMIQCTMSIWTSPVIIVPKPRQPRGTTANRHKVMHVL